MVFSGIVESTALVSRVTKETGLYRLEIKTDSDFSSGLQIGGSVCVDGVCLTASSINSNFLVFEKSFVPLFICHTEFSRKYCYHFSVSCFCVLSGESYNGDT